MAAPVIATGRRTNAGMDLPKSCKKNILYMLVKSCEQHSL